MFGALALLTVGASGCARPIPTAPVTPDDAGFTAEAPPPRPGIDDVDETEPEVIRPGDVLSARIVGDNQLDVQQTSIDRAGFIHLPLIGSVKVAGKSLEEAQSTVQKALRTLDRYSVVNLGLVEGKGRTATVLGAVERTGVIPLVGDPRLADVLAAAGGPRSTGIEDRLVSLGDLDGTRVMRNGKPLPIDVRQALSGDVRHNVRIRPGDVVYVPPTLAARVTVLGHVGHPRTMAFRQGMRLSECLAEAGGLTKLADGGDIRVVRGGFAKPRVYTASLKDLVNGRGPDIVLAAGDIVYVTEHWFASVGEVLEKLIPVAVTGLAVSTVAAR